MSKNNIILIFLLFSVYTGFSVDNSVYYYWFHDINFNCYNINGNIKEIKRVVYRVSIDPNNQNEKKEEISVIYKYDNNKRLIEKKERLNSTAFPYTEGTFKYKNGKLIESEELTKYDNKIFYKYDNYENPIEIKKYTNSGDSLGSETMENKYNKDGKLIEIKAVVEYPDNNGFSTMISALSYNNNGDIIKIFTKTLETGDLLQYSYKYQYDDKSNILEMIKYRYEDMLITKNKYKYSSDNKLLEKTIYDLFEDGAVSGFTTDIFDNKGKLLKKKIFDSQNNLLEFDTYEYEYNKKGKLIKLVTLYNGEKCIVRVEYKYDNNDNLTEENFYYNFQNNEFRLEKKVEYTNIYNDNHS